ncbi:MAG: NHL repeat-containing protein [Coriobacteriia bacterium]|nr:NHL repeat-containing protein [Coriobacteriia bacterium]
MAQEQDTKVAVDAASASAVRVSPEDEQNKGVRRSRMLLIVILIVLIILLLLACGTLYSLLRPGAGASAKGNANGVEWIRSVYGFGVNPNQLMHPTSVAVSPDGQSFWVTDGANFRLIEYGMNGSFKRLVTQTSAGQKFQYPNRMAIAPNGWFYVSQQTYDTVLVFDPDFNLKQTLQVQTPLSVAVNNDMFVVGSQGGFAAFKRDGSLIGQVGTQGSGKDSFDTVSGLALDAQDNLYVVDTYNCRLSKYDAKGNRIWIVNMGFPGNKGIQGGANVSQKELESKYPANLQVPMGVTLDANNRVIVIDMFDYSVSAFSVTNGKFLGKWGEFGVEDGFFSNPSSLVYNRQQDVFLEGEAALGRVQIFHLANSSSMGGLRGLISRYADIINACLIPLLVLLALIVIYVITRILLRRRRNADKNVVELES